MAKIVIVVAESKGVLATEVLWLKVLEDNVLLEYFAVCDTTYVESGKISNKLRHVFWLPTQRANKGDYIALRTCVGKNSVTPNDKGTFTYTYYWNLAETVWNKAGDCAVLFDLSGWSAHKV